MPVSVRLDDETKKMLDRISRLKRIPRSEVIRRGIGLMAREEGLDRDGVNVAEQLESVIGSVTGGPPELSERTGDRFRELVSGRRRG
ncbi:MAG: ribbon-helix-helix protein, CopG family [Acidobacteria bacterium]|nr:ribbon-helix-helix protein, CopG family [Acidobacteriota bacterium]